VNKVSLPDEGLLDSVKLDFMPDNLRYAPNGTLLTAGSPVSFPTILAALYLCRGPVAPLSTKVAQIDPITMESRVVYTQPAGSGFGGGTTAMVIGEELWVSSFRAKRLLTVPLSATGVHL
jgi:hypothetical protein